MLETISNFEDNGVELTHFLKVQWDFILIIFHTQQTSCLFSSQPSISCEKPISESNNVFFDQRASISPPLFLLRTPTRGFSGWQDPESQRYLFSKDSTSVMRSSGLFFPNFLSANLH